MAWRNGLCCLLVYVSSWTYVPRAEATVLDDVASPVTTPARVPLLIGTGLTLILVTLEDEIVDRTQRDITEDRPMGSYAKWGERYGRGQINAAYAAGMLVAGLAGNKNGYRRAWEMAEGSLFAVGTTALLKEIIHEPRPNNGNDKQSFPSGHATGAFAFAAVVQAEHGWAWGIPALGLATAIAVSRMNDNKHYLHDVVAGATIGTAYGLGVYYSHHRDGGGSLAFSPILLDGGAGAMVSLKF